MTGCTAKKGRQKKAEKEKMLNEPDPEKTRKWEVCVCFWPSLVGFQYSTTWQCIAERTQKSLEEDGTQDKELNCSSYT